MLDAYWKAQLANLPSLLQLPYDRPRPARQSFDGAQFSFLIDSDLYAGLLELSAREHVTAFMTLQAIIAVLLGRLSGQTDIIIGCPFAGRTDPALAEVVGFFVNTLPLRMSLQADVTVSGLLAQVREQVVGADENQDIPFERIVEVVNPGRDLGSQPLFQVMTTFQAAVQSAFALSDLSATASMVNTGTSRFDLLFDLREVSKSHRPPNGLLVTIEYSTELFDVATIENFVDALKRIAEDFVSRPNALIRSIDAAVSRGQLEWTQGPTKPLPTKSLSQRIAQQCQATPAQVAITWLGDALSYSRLDGVLTHISNELVARGVTSSSVVAVLMRRSLAQVVAVLGVNRAGATFLPLDTSMAPERISAILEDARPALVLTDEDRPVAINSDVPTWTVGDSIASQSAIRPDEGLLRGHSKNSPLHPCYVMYTSGSTGLPKAVVVPENAVVHMADWYHHELRRPRRSVVAHFAKPTFDVSVMELASTLMHGGIVAVVPDELRTDPKRLVDWMVENRVTEVSAPTTVLNVIARAIEDVSGLAPRDLAVIVQAGESLHLSEPLQRLVGSPAAPALYNMYGATETFYSGGGASAAKDGRAAVPIGRPAWDTGVYVLDSQLRLCPIGVTGEIYIAGIGLANGYLRQPSMTAQRFVACPFQSPGIRMYRTGDLGRYDKEGILQHCGRADYQFKVRGIRIEPSEVEATLLAHPAVKAVAVQVWDNGHSSDLVAYLVPQPGSSAPRLAELRQWATSKLDAHMLPTMVVVMDSLPHTYSGKIDRLKLQQPSRQTAGGISPRNSDEEIMASLFGRSVGLRSVPVDVSFFDLGGHSLLLAGLVDQIEKVFGVEMRIEDVLENQTVEQLCHRVRSADGGASGRPTCATSQPNRSAN